MENYYEVLGVPEDAGQEHIKKAYRALAKKHHPDAPGGDDATFRALNAAYRILSDPDARNDYDKTLKYHRSGAGSIDGYLADTYEVSGERLEQILRELFRQGRLTRVRIKQDGRTLLDMPFSTAAGLTLLGFAFAPIATLLLNVGINRYLEMEVTNVVMDTFEKAMNAHNSGDVAGAESLYKQVIEKSEFFVPAHLNLGMLYRQRGETQLAIQSFRKVLEMVPFGPLGDAARENLEALRGF